MRTLTLLHDRPDLAPWVAAALEREWPHWYGPGGPGNLAADVAAFGASPLAVPVGLLVLEDGIPLGFGALKAVSIPSHAHLTPWAAAGYVVPERRGQGLGAALLQGLVAQAQRLGFPTVHCATGTAERLLERAGWHRLESVHHDGQLLGVYRSPA